MKKPWEEDYGSKPAKARRQALSEALDDVGPKPWEANYQAPAAETFSPADGMSRGEKLLVGAGAATDRALRGLTGVAKSVAGVVAPGNVWSDTPDAGAADAELYKRNHPGGWATAGEVAGDIAMGAVPVAGVASKLSRLPLAMKTLGRAAPLAGDVAANAGYAALTTPEERGTAAALGGGGAAAGRVLTKALGRLARPAGELSEQAKLMFQNNIQPTFGQVMESSGSMVGKAIKGAEDAALNIPVVGSLLVKRRQEAQQAFQQAIRDAALPPGASSEAVKSVDQLGKTLNEAYETTLQSTPLPKEAVAFDPLGAVRRIAEDHAVVEGRVAQAERIVNNAFKGNLSADATAAPAHRIESILKAKAFALKRNMDADQQALGNLLQDVANEWGQTWRSGLPEAARDAVGAIDKAYGKFVPVRRAAGSGSAKTIDEITPSQMLTAIRQGDKSPTKSGFIAGNRPQQELATTAESVIGSSNPEAAQLGTFGKTVLGGSSVGAAFSPALAIKAAPLAVAGALAHLGYSTKVVQRYLNGRLAPEVQRAMDEALTSAVTQRAAAQVGRAGGTVSQR